MDSVQEQKIASLKDAIANYVPGALASMVEEEKRLAPIKNKAMALLNHRARSTTELEQRLAACEFSAQDIQHVIRICMEQGLLNDAQFAQEWVIQRHASQKRSRNQLRHELRKKGIADIYIDDALSLIDGDDEYSAALGLIEKKARSIKTAPQDYAQRMKYLRRLSGVAIRKGFSPGMCMNLASTVLNQRIQELD